MSMDWIGSLVSLDCGEALGTYQGHVVSVDHSGQSISIAKAFRNGIQCKVPKITINASDITDLKIVKTASEAKAMPVVRQAVLSSSEAASIKNSNDALVPASVSPIKESLQQKRLTPTNTFTNHRSGSPANKINSHFHHSASSPSMRYLVANGDSNHSNGYGNGSYHKSNGGEYMRQRTNSESETRGRRTASTPRKIENGRRRTPKDDCFSAPVDTFLGEFDFEKNLALFDKKAVFEEIENNHPNIIKASEKKQPTKYKCDENVLQSGPVVYRQIKVPKQTANFKEYVTDCGLVIPTIPYELRSALFSAATKYGYGAERIMEMVGRSASEMALQLLGGSHRLSPQNSHQRPSVVVLCGPHQQGAQGINCARHLANHNVKVSVFVPNFVKAVPLLKAEIELYELTGGKRVSSVRELPDTPVDIIISAVDSHENCQINKQAWYCAVQEWANQNKAQVLSVDPPGHAGAMDSKWSLSLALPQPLSSHCGQVYLCDLGFPKQVFKEVGITYTSPFGHKFVIPLHLKA